jgi:hypothetical protein
MPAIKTGGVPTLDSFESAEVLWNRTKPWRDKARDNVRPLDKYNRRKRHFALVKIGDRSFQCRLYGTTLVEYWKDGRITLTAHSSKSSNAFANALLPSGVWVRYTQNIDAVMMCNEDTSRWGIGYIYQFKGSQLDIKREEGKWVVADPSQTQPWQDRKIDMKKYNQVLRELGYPAFRDWHRAARQLKPETGSFHWYANDYAAALRDGPEKWTELQWYNNNDLPRLIQEWVKKRYNDQVTLVVKEHEYLHSWNEMDRFRKQAEKFG